jgi:hypothetical protein
MPTGVRTLVATPVDAGRELLLALLSGSCSFEEPVDGLRELGYLP